MANPPLLRHGSWHEPHFVYPDAPASFNQAEQLKFDGYRQRYQRVGNSFTRQEKDEWFTKLWPHMGDIRSDPKAKGMSSHPIYRQVMKSKGSGRAYLEFLKEEFKDGDGYLSCRAYQLLNDVHPADASVQSAHPRDPLPNGGEDLPRPSNTDTNRRRHRHPRRPHEGVKYESDDCFDFFDSDSSTTESTPHIPLVVSDILPVNRLAEQAPSPDHETRRPFQHGLTSPPLADSVSQGPPHPPVVRGRRRYTITPMTPAASPAHGGATQHQMTPPSDGNVNQHTAPQSPWGSPVQRASTADPHAGSYGRHLHSTSSLVENVPEHASTVSMSACGNTQKAPVASRRVHVEELPYVNPFYNDNAMLASTVSRPLYRVSQHTVTTDTMGQNAKGHGSPGDLAYGQITEGNPNNAPIPEDGNQRVLTPHAYPLGESRITKSATIALNQVASPSGRPSAASRVSSGRASHVTTPNRPLNHPIPRTHSSEGMRNPSARFSPKKASRGLNAGVRKFCRTHEKLCTSFCISMLQASQEFYEEMSEFFDDKDVTPKKKKTSADIDEDMVEVVD